MTTDRIQISVMQKVEKDIKKKLAMKNSFKRSLEAALERVSRRIFHRISNNPKVEIKKYRQESSFGYDEFGRDVEDGLRQYIKLLKSRKLQIHTVLVLGSRAKGSWTPQSDVDVTIIASNLPKEGKNPCTRRLFGLKRKLILSDRPLYLGIEPSGCCSQVEFLERLKLFDVQALDAVFYGRVIYDDGFWSQVLENFKEMQKTYKLPIKEVRLMLWPL